MTEPIRDTKTFKTHVQTWVDQIDDPQLNAAWTTVKGFIKIMAEAEAVRSDPTAAEREHWTFFVGATLHEDAPLIHLGMVERMLDSVPRPTEVPFLAIIDEAHELARQNQQRRRAKTGAEPRLAVVDGGWG